jgi:hypothetical protein
MGHPGAMDLNSVPHVRSGAESLLWTHDGKLRLSSALTVLLAAHLLATALVLQLQSRIEVAPQRAPAAMPQ